MTRALEIQGRYVVPDNRWDLTPDMVELPSVTVVVPYYDQPHQLSLVLEALAQQRYPSDRMQVVIADDGSPTPPVVDDWRDRLAVTVVRQEDKGFRAAAARNLGARAGTGEVLCFLDADTVPTPGYLETAVALPAVAPDTVVVGRRGHADLSDVSVSELSDWLRTPRELGEPDWLSGAYGRTDNLLRPGWDGYKFVISAVLTCSRELFEEIGGFDETFVQYGGEDWEFANRAFMAGAVFAHEPDAVAWHDGPDWAGRDVTDRTDEKNTEAVALAPLITDPSARRHGLAYRIPDAAVILDVAEASPASVMVTVAGIVRGVDCAVWLTGEGAPAVYDALALDDSRVRVGTPDRSVGLRCRFVVHVRGPVQFSSATWGALTGCIGPGLAGRVTVDCDGASVSATASRALNRARRWAARTGESESELLNALFTTERRSAEEVGISLIDGEPWLAW
ncbi:glycosyltransferase [Rhodococcus sp. 114MFTsu3.1]|uniref:glycosyltransferase n=1 Tax=Rhodococcus sp. 114MFTsu3.1 TaxID=1172184 RepID=UPI0003799375|nr:glycosyltransferase [Rhodococcus sp. 114MFTsu3.1]